METGDELASRNSPCRNTYGEYLKKNANRVLVIYFAPAGAVYMISILTSVTRTPLPYLAVLLLLSAAVSAAGPPMLRWAGDAEGGAPYVEADPADPSRMVGFDVEIAELIAKG